MTPERAHPDATEALDIRTAAALVGRHPETVRRWVWTGRLAAHRERGRLMVDRADVEALAGTEGGALTLDAWAELARTARGRSAGSAGSAADLVIEDRVQRSGLAGSHARR